MKLYHSGPVTLVQFVTIGQRIVWMHILLWARDENGAPFTGRLFIRPMFVPVITAGFDYLSNTERKFSYPSRSI